MVRINRQPTDKPHARLRAGDVVTLPLARDVLVVQVVALAQRRGPAVEARLLYRPVDPPPDPSPDPSPDPGAPAAQPGHALRPG